VKIRAQEQMEDAKPRDRQLTHREVVAQPRTFPICIIADGIEAAVNVGSLFRLAEAFGVEKVFLTGGSPAPPNSKLRKTSRAAERAVAYESRADALEIVRELKAAGYVIASLEITERAIDIRSFADRFDKLALIVGAESTGVTQALIDESDVALRIPMFGRKLSLNLAAACAIAVFELTKRFAPEVR
jgi:tRNA G18 (ribose-2'-O)-methylase SpoU